MTFMSRKWALVTGANGFLGARLVRALIERGDSVKALVRAGSNLDQLRDLPESQLKIASGDVRMCDRVYAALNGCDRMYHVAATFSLDERRRTEVLADAEEGAAATLEAARRAGIDKIVMTSSTATLGCTTTPEELDESAAFNISQPMSYTQAKFGAEQIAFERIEAGLPLVLVNPSVMIGPGDWKPTPAGQQIVEYLKYSPSFRVPYLVGGFSYADVDDVAQAHISAMEKGRIGERYILGGENLTYLQVFQLLADVTGLAEPGDELSLGKAQTAAFFMGLASKFTGAAPLLSAQFLKDYYGKYLFVSSDKAREELGYQPRSAREAFARSCKWFLDNGYVPPHAARRARLELLPA
jgi:dihydroflavonol-4-reductase